MRVRAEGFNVHTAAYGGTGKHYLSWGIQFLFPPHEAELNHTVCATVRFDSRGTRQRAVLSVNSGSDRALMDVGPAGFLLADDFGNARIHFTGEGEEIFGFHTPHLHGIAAGQKFDAHVG
jgi:hypothetical protein